MTRDWTASFTPDDIGLAANLLVDGDGKAQHAAEWVAKDNAVDGDTITVIDYYGGGETVLTVGGGISAWAHKTRGISGTTGAGSVRCGSAAQGVVLQGQQGKGAPGIFGDGSTGVVEYTAGVTTLDGTPVYATTIAFRDGCTVSTTGTQFFATESILIEDGALVSCSGGASGSNVGGTGAVGGVLGLTGGSGASNQNGAASGAGSYAGGAGGAGGAGEGKTGGATVTTKTFWSHDFVQAILLMRGANAGGAGGGAGGGDATHAGGGGGGGGGVILMASPSITIAGDLEAKGGSGGVSQGGNAGGGGGGGGGLIVLVANALDTGDGAISVAGGAAGAKTGTGTAGAVGSAGVIVSLTPTL